ncbi:MAG TPA: hypothetical protein VGX76_24925 [Pirellulales bacterium]|nr:hypothetical protein [Pirellulales bacterium]
MHAPDPMASLYLDGGRRGYQPGEALSGRYHVAGLKPGEACTVEISVVWYTEGQGDEDLAVHHFERFSTAERREIDLRRPQRFSTTLPASPLSYQGSIVKIRWCVRLRIYLPRGKELFREVPFQLGSVPPARNVASSKSKESAGAREKADVSRPWARGGKEKGPIGKGEEGKVEN